jgi:hypothetical protein
MQPTATLPKIPPVRYCTKVQYPGQLVMLIGSYRSFPCVAPTGSRSSEPPKFLVVLSVRAVSFHPGESTCAFQRRSSQVVLVSSFKGD